MSWKIVLRALLGLSLLLNLCVLAAAAWLAWGGGVRVLTRRFVEPEHVRWVSQFELLPVERGDVVFLGDSITLGGRWHELFPGVPVRNRGIGGDTTTGVLDRLEPIARGQPGQLFLAIGTNDLFIGTPPQQIAAGVLEIVERVERASPDTEVFVQSVLPRAAEWAERVEELNVLLEQVAKQAGATWIDLYPHFLDESDRSIADELANDELHLLGPGYLLWRSQIAGYVRGGPGATRAGSVELESVDLEAVARVAANDTERWRLINLWATWCTPCLTELPLLVEIDRRYRDLEVVTLSIDDLEQRGDALEFLEKIGASTRNLIIGLADARELARVLDREWQGPLPYTVLIAPGGALAYRKLGAFDPVELEGVIVEQLGSRAR